MDGDRRGAHRRRDPCRSTAARRPINKAASYRIAVNNFMADGGDNYTVFRSCTQPLGGDVDLDAFARYLDAHSPVAPPALTRIEKVG